MKKILVGDKFLCTKTVIMDPSEEVAYKKGKIYYSDYDDCITDEQGDMHHRWIILSDEFIECFEKVVENKKDTSETNSFELIQSLSDLENSNKIWRIKDTGEHEIIEFVIKHPQLNNCGIFIDKAGNTLTVAQDLLYRVKIQISLWKIILFLRTKHLFEANCSTFYNLLSMYSPNLLNIKNDETISDSVDIMSKIFNVVNFKPIEIKKGSDFFCQNLCGKGCKYFKEYSEHDANSYKNRKKKEKEEDDELDDLL